MDRYANEKTVEVPHRSGSNVRIVIRRPRANPRQRFFTYNVSAADLMWTLANRFFSESKDWWFIADFNPHVVCPDDLRWDTKLIIPSG